MNAINGREMLLLGAALVFSLWLVGCVVSDPIAQRAVALELPKCQANDDIQKALQIIDDVFVGNGLGHGETPAAEDRAQGILVTYGRYTVLTNSQSLVVNFVEFGQRHSSPIVDKMCVELRERLSDGFAAGRVTEYNEASSIGVH